MCVVVYRKTQCRDLDDARVPWAGGMGKAMAGSGWRTGVARVGVPCGAPCVARLDYTQYSTLH